MERAGSNLVPRVAQKSPLSRDFGGITMASKKTKQTEDKGRDVMILLFLLHTPPCSAGGRWHGVLPKRQQGVKTRTNKSASVMGGWTGGQGWPGMAPPSLRMTSVVRQSPAPVTARSPSKEPLWALPHLPGFGMD
ncbi:predicted protein [Histoplasma capsulatum G186AR]|uniref:Uncharacterized protein n=1 Tax=Ajellomyces capsulatus (strain G186AR / H82 / ATCC MYA-2454 / RMSCC 2432) TaxID=447093 RepID=C0NU73_AJECG|nr:uncharacterized protein HCBG_06904 [Histoplasma capsulatum G186AR]EEH04953.1 predicted protein [Histoplasma capsulatum G186AR]